jgi:hypothetical protein
MRLSAMWMFGIGIGVDKIFYFIKLKWVDKDLAIRFYLLLFYVIILVRVIQSEVDNQLVGIVVVHVCTLIGMKTVEKIKGGRNETNDN